MTEMLTRSVIDNRIIRGTAQLETSLGATMDASFERPTLGDLPQQTVMGFNAFSGLTNEERIAARQAEADRVIRLNELQTDMLSESDPVRRDAIISEITKMQDEPEITLDGLARQAVNDGRMVSAEDLNKEFGDIGLTFDRAATRDEAEAVAENRRAEIVRNAIIEAGPKGVIPTIAQFGAGLAAMAVDPVEVATMFIPVVGQAGRAAAIGRFGRVGGRAAVGAVEGLVGNALTEPLYYGLSRQQQLDYTMSDALTNVGLGALFGGVLGAGIGAFSRADPNTRATTDVPSLDPELTRQSADIALRQFATGQPVNISRLLDGTDLRSTTALSRVNGIDFQSARMIDLPVGQNSVDLRPTVLALDAKGKPRVFDTPQKAEAFAAKTGGQVAMGPNGLTVRQPIDGEIVRNPFGKPLTFRTERAAEKFIAAARDIPEGAKPIRLNVNGKPEFGVAHSMDTKTFNALQRGADTMAVPDGINTRQPAVLPDAEARLDEAVRGTFAEAKIAKEFATDAQNLEMDPQADFKASARADVVLPDTFAEEAIAEMDALVRQLDQADQLSAEAKAELAEIKDVEIKAKSYTAASEAATTCLLGA